jgi:hypothetical protein
VLLSWWIHHGYAHWQALGLNAYLASKRNLYEHHITRYSSWLSQFIVWLVFLVPAWLLFELLSTGITAGQRRLGKNQPN